MIEIITHWIWACQRRSGLTGDVLSP